jgi:uncharacterized repeat protein (TIGR01451 family)
MKQLPAKLSIYLTVIFGSLFFIEISEAGNLDYQAHYYAGRIGDNKSSTRNAVCPNNKVLVGVRVEDRRNVGSAEAYGIIMRYRYLCAIISVNASGNIVVTPDGTWRTAYNNYDQGDGTEHTAQCPANTVAHRMAGDVMYSNTYNAYWASSVRLACRPLTFNAQEQVVVDMNTTAQVRQAGDDENNNGSAFHGWFCGPGPSGVSEDQRVVAGVIQQLGGEGFDGLDVRCKLIAASDYGDAPASYGVASHVINGGTQLGVISDHDTGSWADGVDDSGNATDDDSTNNHETSVDDEDSVSTFPELFEISTKTYSLDVNVTQTTGNDALLVGWIDFNLDGDFDTNEAASTTISNGTFETSATLTWNNVNNLTTGGSGQSYLRLRISTDSALSTSTPTSASSLNNGEVEDHAITIQQAVADIEVTKSDNDSNYTPGQSSLYQITVTNNGPAGVEGVLIEDMLPDGATLSGPWNCTVMTAGSGGGDVITSCPASGGGLGNSAITVNADIALNGVIQINIPVVYSETTDDY